MLLRRSFCEVTIALLFEVLPVRSGFKCWTPTDDPATLSNTTSISLTPEWGTWEGWGTSLAWWAQAFGGDDIADGLADLLFTLRETTITTNSGTFTLPGLGLNIARVVAGASGFDGHEEVGIAKWQKSPNISRFRQQHTFWVDWYSRDLASSSWDWSADPNRSSLISKASARGVNIWELFSNSPVWWMCKNHNPSGSEDGATNNLQAWNHANHTFYLASVATYFAKHRGISFDFVEPFNEPMGDWWTSTYTQEGCHFDRDAQKDVIKLLRKELDAQALHDVGISASDENTYDLAADTWSAFDESTQKSVAKINVHGYQYSNGRRDRLYENATGKRLWNSEYTDKQSNGLGLTSCLNLDFQWLHPTAWVYWQPLDSGQFGLIQSNPGDHWIGGPNPKYFVFAHYTRHIRPGMTIVNSGERDSVAALDKAGKLVIVSVNYNVPRYKSFHVGQTVSKDVTRWCTNIDGVDSYKEYLDTHMQDGRFWSWFDANTVQTFEVQLYNHVPDQTSSDAKIALEGVPFV